MESWGLMELESCWFQSQVSWVCCWCGLSKALTPDQSTPELVTLMWCLIKLKVTFNLTVHSVMGTVGRYCFYWVAPCSSLTLQRPAQERPWSPCLGVVECGCQGDAGSGCEADWAAPCWTAASAGSLWRRWNHLWELHPLWSEELRKWKIISDQRSKQQVTSWHLTAFLNGTWAVVVAGRSLVAHVATLAVVLPRWSYESNKQEVMRGTQEVVTLSESGQNLREFLGRPGPMETWRTFPLGFRTASSPWPTWNWICLDPEELNGPHPPFFTLYSRLEIETEDQKTIRQLILSTTDKCANMEALV